MPVATACDLTAIVQQFRNSPDQQEAIQWFQASTGAQKQVDFAQLWRRADTGAAVDFRQMFQEYQGLPHQDQALQWLQTQSQPRTFAEFCRLWRLTLPDSPTIRLNVPFWNQVDNRFEPMRTCNTSSCAMVAKFLGANIASDDAYYQVVRQYGDTTDHHAQTQALKTIGIQSTWHTNLGFTDLDQSLQASLPIVIGILHRGDLHHPTGGHMIVVIGQTPNGDYICHDPFGSLLDPGGAYTGDVRHGQSAVYPRQVLQYRWLPEGDRSGWGRLFYGNERRAIG